jgi:hypothetical protein
MVTSAQAETKVLTIEQVKEMLPSPQAMQVGDDLNVRIANMLMAPKIRVKDLQVYPVDTAPTDPVPGQIYYRKSTASLCIWLADPSDAKNSKWELISGLKAPYCD